MFKHVIFTFSALLVLAFSAHAQEDSVKVSGPVTIGTSLVLDYKNPKEYEIGPIRIEGADNFDHQAIKLVSGLRTGQRIKLPGDKISTAIKNLWDEGLFSDVEIYAEKEIAGVVYLVIQLQPRPKLSRFKFVGVNRREADKIREEISLFSGKTITENLVFTTQNKIKGYFREKGFYSVNVTIRREIDSLMNNSELFLIRIDKGEKVKIGELEVEGVSTLPQWKLRMAMKDTKKRGPLRIFKRSKLSQAAFDRDKKAIIAKLNGVGLRDAIVVSDTVYLKDPKNLVVKIRVDEGNKYYFGNFEWQGNTKFRTGYLDTVLGIKYGDVYNKSLLDQRLNMSQDGRDISSLYMDRGYLFFQVNAVERNIDSNHIHYQIRIIEGKEARVRNIYIKGNSKTNEHVIRREIRTKPGDLFNRNDIIRTQRELAQLGYFNEQAFQVNPMPNPADGTVDIEYVVEEKSSDQIELSGGYGAGRVIGTLGLTFNNFSLGNVFSKGAWSPLPAGDGQRLSLRAQTNGRFFQAYTLSFTEPWLGGRKPNSLSFWVNHTSFALNGLLKRSDPKYSGLGISGVGVGMGRRKKVPDDYFNVYYELSYQYYDVQNFKDLFPSFAQGFANDISLKYILQRNSVDNPIYPKEGSKILFSAKSTLPYSVISPWDPTEVYSQQDRFKYLEYYKLKLTGEWYLPLTSDKKLVLMPRFGYGLMGAYSNIKGLSPFERFSLGGRGLTGMNGQFGGREIIALRGYDDPGRGLTGGNSGVGVSSVAGDPLIAKYTLELRYPISLNPQATFFVLGFAEAGNTFTDFRKFNPFNVKRSAGVGIRIFLPMFGMLGVDYGWGFDRLDPHSAGFGGPSDQSIQQKGYYGKLNFTIGMNLGEL